jgi:hypothetical protein
MTVTNYHERGKTETTTAFDDLGDPADMHDTVDEIEFGWVNLKHSLPP